MEFHITATGPDGTRSDVTFRISAPERAGRDDYICSYRVDPLGLNGTVLAGDPFKAVRWALLEMRVKLVHRFAGWTFLYPDGRPILLDYDEPA